MNDAASSIRQALVAAEVTGAGEGEGAGARAINFFYDFMFVKEPGTREVTRWHQDEPYWAVKGEQVCSVWLPLDPVPKVRRYRLTPG